MDTLKKAVCALIPDEDARILAVSRKDNHRDFGLPGGKVEENESYEDALIREVREETGLDVKIVSEVFSDWDGDYWTKTFHCEILSLTIDDSKEAGIVKWVDWIEICDKSNSSFWEYNSKLFLDQFKDIEKLREYI